MRKSTSKSRSYKMPGIEYTDAGTTKLAGALGFEPRSAVLETASLTVELTPLKQFSVVSS